MTFAETDPISSGSDSETMEHVKHMIGLNSRSLVLASPDNYKVLINRFGFCGYNRTWADPNSLVINSMIMKNFKANVKTGNDYFSLTEQDFILSNMQKQSIYKYIQNNGGQLASMKYNIFDPILCKYSIYVYVKLKSNNHNTTMISQKIRQYIGEFFTDIQSDMFIPKSDVVHLLKSKINDIDSVDVYFISQQNEEAINRGYYTDEYYILNELTGQYIKKIENVKVYPGENPNIGLDNHGNIYLKSDQHFPVLMGGWKYINDDGDEVQIIDPLTIIFED